MSQEFQDPFDPCHERCKQSVIVHVNFVNEFVEVIFVAGTEVDEGLDGLIWVGGDVLALGGFDDFYGVVGELGEVGDGAIDVCGFVDADEGFVEDLEEVAEEFEGCWLGELLAVELLGLVNLTYLFDDFQHHGLISLSEV